MSDQKAVFRGMLTSLFLHRKSGLSQMNDLSPVGEDWLPEASRHLATTAWVDTPSVEFHLGNHSAALDLGDVPPNVSLVVISAGRLARTEVNCDSFGEGSSIRFENTRQHGVALDRTIRAATVLPREQYGVRQPVTVALRGTQTKLGLGAGAYSIESAVEGRTARYSVEPTEATNGELSLSGSAVLTGLSTRTDVSYGQIDALVRCQTLKPVISGQLTNVVFENSANDARVHIDGDVRFNSGVGGSFRVVCTNFFAQEISGKGLVHADTMLVDGSVAGVGGWIELQVRSHLSVRGSTDRAWCHSAETSAVFAFGAGSHGARIDFPEGLAQHSAASEEKSRAHDSIYVLPVTDIAEPFVLERSRVTTAGDVHIFGSAVEVEIQARCIACLGNIFPSTREPSLEPPLDRPEDSTADLDAEVIYVRGGITIQPGSSVRVARALVGSSLSGGSLAGDRATVQLKALTRSSLEAWNCSIIGEISNSQVRSAHSVTIVGSSELAVLQMSGHGVIRCNLESLEVIASSAAPSTVDIYHRLRHIRVEGAGVHELAPRLTFRQEGCADEAELSGFVEIERDVFTDDYEGMEVSTKEGSNEFDEVFQTLILRDGSTLLHSDGSVSLGELVLSGVASIVQRPARRGDENVQLDRNLLRLAVSTRTSGASLILLPLDGVVLASNSVADGRSSVDEALVNRQAPNGLQPEWVTSTLRPFEGPLVLRTGSVSNSSASDRVASKEAIATQMNEGPSLRVAGGILAIDCPITTLECAKGADGNPPTIDIGIDGRVGNAQGQFLLGSLKGLIHSRRPGKLITWAGFGSTKGASPTRRHSADKPMQPGQVLDVNPAGSLELDEADDATSSNRFSGQLAGLDVTRCAPSSIAELSALHAFDPDGLSLAHYAKAAPTSESALGRAQRLGMIASAVAARATSGATYSYALWAATHAHARAVGPGHLLERFFRLIHRSFGYGYRPLPALVSFLVVTIGWAFCLWALNDQAPVGAAPSIVAGPYGAWDQWLRVVALPTGVLRLDLIGVPHYPSIGAGPIQHIVAVISVAVPLLFVLISARNYLRTPTRRKPGL